MRPSTPEEVAIASYAGLGNGPVVYVHPDDEFVSRRCFALPRSEATQVWRAAAGDLHPSSRSRRPMSRRLRVVQWTTGKTGSAAVRGMAGHPVLDLVGCYAFSADKVGRDVGEFCGISPLGIRATDDVEALLALEPDCVSYMAYRPNFDHLERILESGANVVATMFMMAGIGYGEAATRRLREACLRGGSSLYASGIYPGHAPMVALAASAMCSRIERLSVLESLDVHGYANEQMFRAQGFDLEPGDPAARAACESSCGSFKDQVPVLAKASVRHRRGGLQRRIRRRQPGHRFRLHDAGQGPDRRLQGHRLGQQAISLAHRVQFRVEAR